MLKKSEKTTEKSKKTIEKLEKNVEDLEKELKKTKSAKMGSTDDTVEAHCKKKEIDLKAFTAEKEVDQQIQKKKEAMKKKTKSRRFRDTESLYRSG